MLGLCLKELFLFVCTLTYSILIDRATNAAAQQRCQLTIAGTEVHILNTKLFSFFC